MASRSSAALSVETAAWRLFEVDTRLRPQGAQGMLAVSLAAFDAYQRGDAWTWEHMALCRARPITGSPAMRAAVGERIADLLRNARDADSVRADAGRMREDIAQHKPPAGALDIKLGPGGLVDLEFAVHTLQLTHHIGLDPRLEVALGALVEAGLIDDGADPDLRLLSRILVVLRLVAPDAMEPAEQSHALVASLCGHPDWSSLVTAIEAARTRNSRRWSAVRGEK